MLHSWIVRKQGGVEFILTQLPTAQVSSDDQETQQKGIVDTSRRNLVYDINITLYEGKYIALNADVVADKV